MTNATKAGAIALVNALLGAAVAFGAPLSDAQVGAVLTVANAALGLWVGLTYKNSSKRLPETDA